MPYTVVIGGKEVESKQVSPRVRGDLKLESETLGLDEFLQLIAKSAQDRS